jgi:hypothetical protein
MVSGVGYGALVVVSSVGFPAQACAAPRCFSCFWLIVFLLQKSSHRIALLALVPVLMARPLLSCLANQPQQVHQRNATVTGSSVPSGLSGPSAREAAALRKCMAGTNARVHRIEGSVVRSALGFRSAVFVGLECLDGYRFCVFVCTPNRIFAAPQGFMDNMTYVLFCTRTCVHGRLRLRACLAGLDCAPGVQSRLADVKAEFPDVAHRSASRGGNCHDFQHLMRPCVDLTTRY